MYSDKDAWWCFQEWSMTRDKLIKHSELCLTLPEPRPGTSLVLAPCQNSDLQVGCSDKYFFWMRILNRLCTGCLLNVHKKSSLEHIFFFILTTFLDQHLLFIVNTYYVRGICYYKGPCLSLYGVCKYAFHVWGGVGGLHPVSSCGQTELHLLSSWWL